MKRNLYWLTQVAFAALVVWSAVLLHDQAASMGVDATLDAAWLVLTILIKMGTIGIAAFKFRALSRLVGLDLTLNEWVGLSVLPTFHSYLSPARTGHVLRAIYLRKQYQFEYGSYAATTAGATLLELSAAAATGLFFCSVLIGQPALSGFFALILTGTLLAPICLTAIANSQLARKHRLLARPSTILIASMRLLTSKRKLFLHVTLFSLASVLARAVGLYASFKTFGFDVHITYVVAIECFRTLAGTIHITPSNIGISEGIIAAVAALFNIPASHSLAAAVLSRLTAMAPYTLAGVWCTKHFFGRLLVTKVEG